MSIISVTPKTATPFKTSTPVAGMTGGFTNVNPYTGPGTATVGAPAPVAPPAPTVTTAPGTTPDFNALITNDPAYAAAQSAAQQAGADAGAQRQAAIRAAIIRYGGMPGGFKDAYGDVDQATQDAATQNQQSTLANLKYNYGTSHEQLLHALAARGALQSGDLNYGQDQLDHGYAQQQYDAANSVGDVLSGQLNTYTGVLAQNARDRAAAINAAEQNVLGQVDSNGVPIYAPQAPQTAAYDPEYSSIYKQPLYKDDAGTYYDANANKYAYANLGGLGLVAGA